MAKKKARKVAEFQDQEQQEQQQQDQQDQQDQQESNNNYSSNTREGQSVWDWSPPEGQQQDQQQEKIKPVAADDGDWGDFGKVKDDGLFDFGSSNDKGLDWASPVDAFAAATKLEDGLDNGVSIDDDNETKTAFDHGASVPSDIPKKKPS